MKKLIAIPILGLLLTIWSGNVIYKKASTFLKAQTQLTKAVDKIETQSNDLKKKVKDIENKINKLKEKLKSFRFDIDSEEKITW